ncbi:unnamed protein product, partial [Prunus brigantina]
MLKACWQLGFILCKLCSILQGRLCQIFGRMSRVFSKWARHRGDVGTKMGSASGLGEIPGRVLS